MKSPILAAALLLTVLPAAAQAATPRHHPARVHIATYTPQPHKPLVHRVRTHRTPHNHLTRTAYHAPRHHSLRVGS